MQVETQWLEQVPFATDAGVGTRARIGVVVLASDYTIEHELNHLWKDFDGVAQFVSRIRNTMDVSVESLGAMGHSITETADRILDTSDLDVLAYGCTSATAVLGEQKVHELLRAARPHVATTSPLIAARAALGALTAKRVAVLTPYPREVNQMVWSYFDGVGIEIPAFASFNEPNDPVVAAIDANSMRAAIRTMLDAHEVDAVFVSCTSLRAAVLVPAFEEEFGVPVTSSNHALAWHCLRLAGVNETRPQHGQLFALTS
jgi:maleate isomerase